MPNTIKISQEGRVVLVTINRPEALNALNVEVMQEMIKVLTPLDKSQHVGCFVITGSDKAFAAGADIKDMIEKDNIEMIVEDYFYQWDVFAKFRTPKIAAVSGYALGGGCELAMMCDMIFAAKSAKFGQPEIKLGVIPGMGGSQRLTKLVGKSKAMDLILTGRMMDATEAERAGLAARVIEDENLLSEAMEAAHIIASYGTASTMMAREVVDRALETSLQEGLLFERRIFHSLFASKDQKEGMGAFIEKRKAKFHD
ncbi:MAG: enoyl-CoA hydratase [Kordiimonadaceae bacterium]|jgi:enoyl-CoA hydratase|nr:enoyl-CoA hydratase [Kordiimonadaceae bacterium]MBT6134390.1 enoyl-CoA hydratase [Kordiimonadaceae bacterium]MBT6466759.1 enoyl-CoA hydratase [Kordiimonadaceae bacterium]MBT7543840.1 enoyl-CoA hydratase [Kordiimonadaceae bacterium]MBT7605370.1 enoyl-CoA hydratase [Kordiimonadaceae bacterium]